MYQAAEINGRCPVTDLPVTRSREWTDIQLAPDYQVTFAVVGDRILLTHATGNAEDLGVTRLFEQREKVLRTAGLWNRNYVEIRDYTDVVKGHPSKGRVQFTLAMIAEAKRGHLKGFWGFNGSFALHAIMNVAKRLVRYDGIPVMFVRDYQSAVLNAVRTRESPGFERPAPELNVELERVEIPYFGDVISQRNEELTVGADDEPVYSRKELRRAVDDLLQFTGTINWAIEGVEEHSVDESNPIKVIYDAISVLKVDFDTAIREKEEVQAQMLSAAKLASVGTLTAGFAHELNNPLTAVLGYAEQVLDATAEPATRKGVGVIQRAARRMQGLVSQLCKQNRQQFLAKGEPLDIRGVIAEALELSEPQRRLRDVRIELSCPPDLPRVCGDAAQLSGVVQNLVSNAFDAFETLTDSRERLVSISAREDAAAVRVQVADNAGGMDRQAQAHAFDPFYTSKDIGMGTGLGLFVAYEIVKAHGGAISMESQPGEGATVSIRLPTLPASGCDGPGSGPPEGDAGS